MGPNLFVVIGDVHAQVGLALTALAQIEQEQGSRIAHLSTRCPLQHVMNNILEQCFSETFTYSA
jgi:hypothetical protein